MSEKKSTQNIVTAVSIIVALVAIVYALMGHVQKPTHIDLKETSEQKQAVTAPKYEVGENNPIVLKINENEITRIEVMDNFAQSGAQLPQGANIQQIFPLLQEQYLIGELIKQAANDRGIDSDHPTVQERLNAVLDQALRAAYIDEVGREKVTDDDIKNAYADIVGNQPTQKERKARHILVEKEATANALIVKLNQGADFAKLAEKESKGPSGPKGGDLGYFAKGEMVPEFEKAAYELEIGKFTQKPVKTQFGYHIIMVEDEREREKPTFEEVKEQLTSQLRQAATAEAIQELRKNSEVTIYDINGEDVAEAAKQPSLDEDETTTIVEETDESASPEKESKAE